MRTLRLVDVFPNMHTLIDLFLAVKGPKMKTVEYLDLAKQRANLPSDYALAQALCVTRQAVSSWRSADRPRYPETIHAFTLATLCNLDPVQVLSDIEIDKAAHYQKQPEIERWNALLKRMGGVAAAALMGAIISPPSEATASMKTPSKPAPTVYIMSTRRRKTALQALAKNTWLSPLFGQSNRAAF